MSIEKSIPIVNVTFSADQELEYLKSDSGLDGKEVFKVNPYLKVILPKSDLFMDIWNNYPPLNKDKWRDFSLEFKNRIFKPIEYIKGKEVLNKEIGLSQQGLTPTWDKMWSMLLELNRVWGFKIYNQYLLCLTLYGPGGSYFANDGIIVLRIDPKGSFMRSNPMHIFFHEIIHIGIEEIILELNFSHCEKESLVNRLFILLFYDIFPLYKVDPQNILFDNVIHCKEEIYTKGFIGFLKEWKRKRDKVI